MSNSTLSSDLALFEITEDIVYNGLKHKLNNNKILISEIYNKLYKYVINKYNSNYPIHFKNHLFRISNTLDEYKDNKTISNLILNKNLQIDNLIEDTEYDLELDKYKLELKTINDECQKKTEKIFTNIRTGPAYRCKKCKNERCSINEVQTRSADEGSTIFYTCTKCEYTWKIS